MSAIGLKGNPDPDLALALVVGSAERWSSGSIGTHTHQRHQLIYALSGVIRLSTESGEWLLPPTRALWVPGGVAHSFLVKKTADTRVLYISPDILLGTEGGLCSVIQVTPLVRELISVCAEMPWEYTQDSKQARLSRVLLDQIETLSQEPVSLPMPTDRRGIRLVEIIRQDPSNREPLSSLAGIVGASTRTIERIFLRETKLPFGVWRQRQRLVTALELLADGQSVTNVALDVGYESASSFVAAFKVAFGTTPARYFK